MGLLAVDVSAFGVVMSADSQPVELLDGQTRVLAQTGQRLTRNPILICDGGGFIGLIGFVGTERIGPKTTRDWLTSFGTHHANESLAEYGGVLGEALTEEWSRHRLASILEILISGVEDGEVRFWFVRNSQGLHDHDWTYRSPSSEFQVVNDLDDNYMPRDLQPGQTKQQLLQARLYSFRQGVLLPAAPVFDAFTTILGMIYSHGVDGFAPLRHSTISPTSRVSGWSSLSGSTATGTASTRSRPLRSAVTCTCSGSGSIARSATTRRFGCRSRH
jgi:hypothetical protein